MIWWEGLIDLCLRCVDDVCTPNVISRRPQGLRPFWAFLLKCKFGWNAIMLGACASSPWSDCPGTVWIVAGGIHQAPRWCILMRHCPQCPLVAWEGKWAFGWDEPMGGAADGPSFTWSDIEIWHDLTIRSCLSCSLHAVLFLLIYCLPKYSKRAMRELAWWYGICWLSKERAILRERFRKTVQSFAIPQDLQDVLPEMLNYAKERSREL